MLEAGLVHQGMEIKVLGTGGLKRKLTVEAHFFSVSAREAIEKVGRQRQGPGRAPQDRPQADGGQAAKAAPDRRRGCACRNTESGESTQSGEAGEAIAREGNPNEQPVEEATPPDEA